jgi:predicted RNase H-like nuclease
MAIERFLGVDLAWNPGSNGKPANETGVVALSPDGAVVAAGWTRGIEATVDWVQEAAGAGSALLFVDAPLIVPNPAGQRPCERQVGQRYGRWKVSANSTNQASPRLAGPALLGRLRALGWSYDDGRTGPPADGRTVSECYPYTTLVGVEELGYDTCRPAYKRQPKSVPAQQRRVDRAAACDELVRRLHRLADADPPLLLTSHPVTAELLRERAPRDDERAYKHREDLLDAVLCAWTALFWYRHGLARVPGARPGRGRPARCGEHHRAGPACPAGQLARAGPAGRHTRRTGGDVSNRAASPLS